MPDTFFTDLPGRHLHQERTKSFFLWVGSDVTHAPFRFPIEFRGRFDPEAFAVPEVAPENVDLIPPVFRDLTDDIHALLAACLPPEEPW